MKKVFFSSFSFDVFDGVYEPAEDSFLLAEKINELNFFGKKVLDLGCGSGILAIIASLNSGKVFALDKDKKAILNTIHNAKRLLSEKQIKNFFVLQSDMFSALKEKKFFDFIFFNPPYLPSEKINDSRIDGLTNGSFFIKEFLIKLPLFLKKQGKAFLLISSLNNLKKVKGIALKANLKIKIVSRKKLFFEELMLLELTHKNKNF